MEAESPSGRSNRMEIVIGWVERATDGSAAGTHLDGTIRRLEELPDVAVRRIVADRGADKETALGKLKRIVTANIEILLSAGRNRTLLCRYHPSLLVGAIFWRALGGAVVFSVQGSIDEYAESANKVVSSRLFRGLASLTARAANGLISGAPVLDDHIRNDLLAPGATFRSIPNGVFLDKLRVAQSTDHPLDGKPYAVYVGNLAPWQGIDFLVNAAESDIWPAELSLVVVGDGEQRVSVRDGSRVVWMGRLPAAEASRWLAHAYVSISLKRTDLPMGSYGYWPFKLIESAALSVPIVATRAPGVSEFAERTGHAVLVPGQDADAAASAVAWLWSNPKVRESLADINEAAVAELDWRSGAGRLGEILRSVRNNPAKSELTRQ